jgi:hypothetical protein
MSAVLAVIEDTDPVVLAVGANAERSAGSRRGALRKKSCQPPRTGGRPTMLTQSLLESICQLAGQGIPIRTVCGHLGITTFNFYHWLKLGDRDLREDDESSVYAQFSTAFARARSRWAISMQAVIALAAPKDWRAAAWLLERRIPGQWSQRVAANASATVETEAEAERRTAQAERTRKLLLGLLTSDDPKDREFVSWYTQRAAEILSADSATAEGTG